MIDYNRCSICGKPNTFKVANAAQTMQISTCPDCLVNLVSNIQSMLRNPVKRLVLKLVGLKFGRLVSFWSSRR